MPNDLLISSVSNTIHFASRLEILIAQLKEDADGMKLQLSNSKEAQQIGSTESTEIAASVMDERLANSGRAEVKTEPGGGLADKEKRLSDLVEVRRGWRRIH